MGRSGDPATLVLCANLAGVPRRGSLAAWGEAPGRAAVTWSADVETLAAAAEAGLAPATLALALEPAWLDSKATLRRMVHAARQAAPGLEAVMLRGPRPLTHATLLAEEGIRVASVDVGDDARRGSRRPAPSGWRCHNPVWGLWEVRTDPPRRRGFVNWLLHGSMPRLRPAALHVLDAGSVPVDRPLGGRLDRWLSWAARRVAGGRLRTVPLADLPVFLARGGQPPVSGSVLKAAA